MKKNPQNEENLKEKEQAQEQSKNKNENGKKGFFKKIWYSIDKIEKYPELSAEGFKSAIKYLAILIVILAFASAAGAFVAVIVVPSAAIVILNSALVVPLGTIL